MITITSDLDLLKFMGKLEQSSIGNTSDWSDMVKALAANGEHCAGEKMPWVKTHDKIGFRPKEVTVWAGQNGSGKSLILGQMLLHFPEDTPCLIASLEMPPEQTILRMARQALGQINITDKFIDEFNERTQNIYIYDQLDSVKPEVMIGLIHFAAQEYGIKHFVIDSLVKCGVSPKDIDEQKTFMDRLCWAARSEEAHIHLVHHTRKGEHASSEPDKYSVKGAGEIVDLTDNCILIHRNTEKERMIKDGKEVNKMVPDEILLIVKQRHFSWDGQFNLWWHESGQFKSGPDAQKLRWRI